MTHVSRFSALDERETKILVQAQIYLCLATRLATTTRYQEGLNTDTDLHENAYIGTDTILIRLLMEHYF